MPKGIKLALKVGSREGSEIRCHFGTCKCAILLLFTILQQGRAFQKTITFGTLFGVLFGPQVSNKWSSNGRIQIGIKTTRFGLHFGVLFGRLGPLSGAWPSPTSQPSPSGHPASSSAKPSQADGAAQPKPNQPSPAQTRQGQPAKQPSAVMATQAESMKSQ